MKIVKQIIEVIKLIHKYGGIIKAIFSGIERIKDEIEELKLDDDDKPENKQDESKSTDKA